MRGIEEPISSSTRNAQTVVEVQAAAASGVIEMNGHSNGSNGHSNGSSGKSGEVKVVEDAL